MQKKWILLSVTVVIFAVWLANADAQKLVPEWIKNTAMWYAQGQVSEGEFLNAIKYLIENKIIVLEEPEDLPVPQETPVIVTKPRLNQCVTLKQYYDNYPETRFKKQFSHIVYLDSCIKLYKDRIWQYQGADRVDKIYQKFLEFETQRENVPKPDTEPKATLLSKTKLGTNLYMAKFSICAGDVTIQKAKILVSSAIEAIQVGSNQDVPANTCRNYESPIRAKNVDNIKVVLLERVLES